MELACSAELKKYFALIDKGVKKSYQIAEAARKKSLDPEKEVSIPLAKNMAERVVGLISVVSPEIKKTNITERIYELEKEYGQLDWRVAFKIAEEVAKEKFYNFRDKQEAIETGIRVGFAYLTLGIVSAPLEGFIGLSIKKRKDGREYLALRYAGPIRGAGGTAAATSVILSDYVRIKMGYAPYDPEEAEINRYIIEVQDYHDRVTNLQYRPSDEEIRFMVSHLPIEVDGDPTERIEVSNYKDLPRIETNLVRGGAALVLAEGLCQKAPKIWKRLSKWGKDFDLDWEFMEEFIELKEKIHAAHDGNKNKKDKTNELENEVEIEKKTVKANNTFIMDLVAGRPILTHPLATGGFRLRYGRNRTSGFSAAATHPATLIVLDKFIAIGTQLKMERPGKGATITVCDTLEGPIVRLEDGSVIQFKTEEEARINNPKVEEVLFLGDILFNYGDFSENGHPLVPAGYCPEWWAREAERKIGQKLEIKGLMVEELRDELKPEDINHAAKLLEMDSSRLKELLEFPLISMPNFTEAQRISEVFAVPLHSDYIFYWKLISGNEFLSLLELLNKGKIKIDEKGIKKIILPFYHKIELYQKGKKVLDHLGIPHKIISKESIILERKEAVTLAFNLGFNSQEELEKIFLSPADVEGKDGLEVVNSLCSVKIRDKAGTFIGARMGRPEKAKMRQLTGSPQVMFPVGEEGGRLRCFQSALEKEAVRNSFPLFFCVKCNWETVYPACEKCNEETEKRYYCRFCGDLDKEECRHGKTQRYKTKDVKIKYFMEEAQKRLGEKLLPDLIKGVRGTSNRNHLVEHLAKGILRAKHEIYMNKDGTTRYDSTELPLTHFKPKEIGVSIETLRSIGYEKDIRGKELVDEDQLLEMKPQDIILPGHGSLEKSAPEVLMSVANFVDELLVKFYGLKPFYKIKTKEDLIGHLVIGLAPHISAGMVGRIIGFSETQGILTNPMFHAGLRRDCDGDEAAVMMLMDALLNFSRQYLPSSRGSTMDAPLVLTSILDPAEVDDQVHGMDVLWKYPLELYEAALEMKNPWEVRYGKEGKKIEQIGDRLGTEKQYEDFGFTHHVDNFNRGVQCSAYKTIPSMAGKLVGQMEIAKKVRAVNMDDVARLVIQKHFLKDIKGNLRKFSLQQFRCVKCNEKYRRPPLNGKCPCTGKIIFTISQGSVIKYLGLSLMLAERYNFSPYLKQTLEIIQMDVDHIFGREKDKQVGLTEFMG